MTRQILAIHGAAVVFLASCFAGCGPTEADITRIVEERLSQAPAASGAQAPEAPAAAAPGSVTSPAPGKLEAAPAGSLRPGSLVFHTTWGDGQVLSLEGEGTDASAKVRFASRGVRFGRIKRVMAASLSLRTGDAEAGAEGIENVYGLSEESIAEANDSARFLSHLDGLMAGYEPVLPALVDNTDVMRCVTAEQRRVDPTVGSVYKGLEKERKGSAKEIRKRRKDFYNRVYPMNFRIDSQWKTRTGFRHEITYECLDTDDDEWCGSRYTKGECANSGWQWRYRSARWVPDETLYLYSNTTTPAPPELMKRMEAQEVSPPERFTCVVDDVERQSEAIYGCKIEGYFDEPYTTKNECYENDGSWKIVGRRFGDTLRIGCVGTGEPAARIRIVAADLVLQRGDAISVPLAGVTRSEEGVLFKEKVRFERDTRWVWTVDADLKTMKVEGQVTTCPDAGVLATMVCKKATSRSDPASVARNCALAGKADKVLAAAKKLQRAREPEARVALLAACETLITLTPADPWAHMALAKAHGQAKDHASLAAALKRAHGALTEAKHQVAVAKEATRAARASEIDAGAKGTLEALAKAANNKACTLGSKPACKAALQP